MADVTPPPSWLGPRQGQVGRRAPVPDAGPLAGWTGRPVILAIGLLLAACATTPAPDPAPSPAEPAVPQEAASGAATASRPALPPNEALTRRTQALAALVAAMASDASQARTAARAELESLAAAGDPVAALAVAIDWLARPPRTRNAPGAVAFLERAVAGGSDPARVLLACALYLGDGIAADPDRAGRLLTQALAGGDPRALVLGARLLAVGLEGLLPPDPLRAEGLLRSAADAGLAAAQGDLARLLDRRGGTQDAAEALARARLAAEAGSGPGARLLAELLSRRGVPQEAALWWDRADALGEPGIAVARLHPALTGSALGPLRDAVDRLGTAATAGDTAAALALARLAEEGRPGLLPPDPALATRWYTFAAKAGDPGGALGLAEMAARESGPEASARARMFYREAAEGGVTAAMAPYAYRLRLGLGGPPHQAEAAFWQALARVPDLGLVDALPLSPAVRARPQRRPPG